MLIDCDQCAMRDTSACDDCVVTFLIGAMPVDLTERQTEAVGNLAAEGLVPRLRLIPVERFVPLEQSDTEGESAGFVSLERSDRGQGPASAAGG